MTAEQSPQPDDIRMSIDGVDIDAMSGRSVLGVLTAAGYQIVRHHPLTGKGRGFYCGMGACFECEVTVRGRGIVRSCLEPAVSDMAVELHSGAATLIVAPEQQ